MAEAVILQALLGKWKKKGPETRYFVLHEDRIDYFLDKESFDANEQPRGCMPLMEVDRAELHEGMLQIVDSTQGHTMSLVQLENATQVDLSLWLAEIKRRIKTADTVLCEGTLQQKKKKGNADRHVVLFKDRLEFHDSPDDRAAEKAARGCIMLEEVSAVEEKEGSFALTIAEEKAKAVELHGPRAEVARWMTALQPLLEATLGGSWVLREQSLGNSSGPGEAGSSDKEGKKQKSKKSKAPQRQSSSPPPEGPAGEEGSPQQSTGAEAAAAAALAAGSPQAAAGSRPLHQGTVPVSRAGKKKPKSRYLVFFSDRLEYYADEASFAPGAEPGGVVKYAAGSCAREVEDGLCLRLDEVELQLHLPELEERRKWLAVMEGIFASAQVPPASEPPATATPGKGANSAEATAAAPAPAPAEPKPVVQPTTSNLQPETPSEVSKGLASHVLEAKVPEAKALQGGLACVHTPSSTTFPGSPASDTEEERVVSVRVLKAGPMLLRGGGPSGGYEAKHLELFRDRLDYFSTEQDARRGAGPEGRIMTSSVHDVELCDKGFILYSENKQTVELQFPEGVDQEEWVVAMERANFGEAAEEETNAEVDEEWQSPGRSSTRSPTRSPTRKDFSSDSQLNQVVQSLASFNEPALHHGWLGFQHVGKMVSWYSFLFKDRLESWTSPGGPSAGDAAVSRLSLLDVNSIEAVGTGFILKTRQSGKVGVHVGDTGALRAWSHSLSAAITSKSQRQPGARATAAQRSTSEQPRKPRERSTSARRRSHDWVPRVATLAAAGSARASPRQPSPERDDAASKWSRINTHTANGSVLHALHGNHGHFQVGPRRSGSCELTSKVNARCTSMFALRDYAAPEAITGPRTNPRWQPRRSSEFAIDRSSAPKINLLGGRPLSVRDLKAPETFTPKVTDACRVPLSARGCPNRSSLSMAVPYKITDNVRRSL